MLNGVMKAFTLVMFLAGLVTATAYAGSEQIIKQRARELSNQNNVRQGVAAPVPQQPAAAQPTTVVAPRQTPQQQVLARLQSSLSGIRPESQATPQKTQQLARDLTAACFGTPKPSPATINKLAESLSAALSQKLLSNPTRNRLLQDLNAVLNPANISKSRMDDVIADIQAVFQSSGLDRKDAAPSAGCRRGDRAAHNGREVKRG
jgi:hypothetical protein